jgi:hypothetical protein
LILDTVGDGYRPAMRIAKADPPAFACQADEMPPPNQKVGEEERARTLRRRLMPVRDATDL